MQADRLHTRALSRSSSRPRRSSLLFFFFFNDTATTEIYTLSLHDALPISPDGQLVLEPSAGLLAEFRLRRLVGGDRKSTRLNSSHQIISYAVFCLKKKKTAKRTHQRRSVRAHRYACANRNRRASVSTRHSF